MQVESHLHHVMSHASQLHHVMMQQPSPSFHLILVHLVDSLCSNNQSPTTAVLYRTQIREASQKRLARHSVHTRYTHTKPLPPSVHRRWP